MIGKTLFAGLTALSLVAVPVAAGAAPAASSINPAKALSLSPSVRTGSRSKGEHLTQSGWIIGVGMIALGAGAIVLALDDNHNDRPASS